MSKKDKFNDEKLEECFEKVSTQTEVALAVSGGPDSMALLLLADRWRRARIKRGQVAPDLVIYSIDHGLRPEAASECEFVLAKARALGYHAETLSKEQPKPKTRLQEMARKLRYQLLAGACNQRGIKMLMTAHHIDDQAETLLMRLARGSGVDGLSAMAPESRHYGLTLFRPLLGFEKSDLVALLEQNNWDYLQDPSNNDPDFERVRLRAQRPVLNELGLTPAMISLGADRLRRAKLALNEVSDQFLAKNALISDYGTARIDQLALNDSPDEIAIRALSKVLLVCGGSLDVPNLAKLEQLMAKLKADFSTSRTLAGCRIIAKGDFWLIVRETGRITELEKPIVPGQCMFWDNRYIVCADKSASKTIVAGPLVEANQLTGVVDESRVQNLPKEARASLLTLRHKGRIIAVPALDYWSEQAIGAVCKPDI